MIESVTIETSTLCNAKCIICPNHLKPRPPHYMPQNEFMKILNFFRNLKSVVLCGMYEPLLDNRFDSFLNTIEHFAPEVTIFTNGSLLTSQNRKLLLRHPNLKHIVVSIHGFSKEVYESIMVGLNRDQVYSNMLNLMQEIGTNPEPKVSVSFVRTKQNINELEEYRKFWKDKVDVVSDFEIMNWRGHIEAKKFLVEKPTHDRACPMYEQPLVIDAMGNIVRCCYDFSFNYGHVLRGGYEKWLSKKWESETYPTNDCKPCLGWHYY
jgi:MoaA/NifB/PqqE/SkfB family radical SAM enzyme